MNWQAGTRVVVPIDKAMPHALYAAREAEKALDEVESALSEARQAIVGIEARTRNGAIDARFGYQALSLVLTEAGRAARGLRKGAREGAAVAERGRVAFDAGDDDEGGRA